MMYCAGVIAINTIVFFMCDQDTGVLPEILVAFFYLIIEYT